MAGIKPCIRIFSVMALLSLTAAISNQQRIAILQELSRQFLEFRMNAQYGVLYMPPPGNPLSVDYIPEDPPSSFTFANRNRPIMFPSLPSNNLPAQFSHNYVAAIPDFRGRTYGNALQRPGTSTIHTEDLFLSLVFDRMITWYRDYYGQDPPAVYLYTYFIPCPECTTIIQNALVNTLIDSNGNSIPLHVGFSQLLGGVRDENVNDARNRRSTLQNFLNNYGGRLFDIGRLIQTGAAVCTLQGQFSRRSKRQASDTGQCSEDEFLFLKMDFNTGKAQVEWYQPTAAQNRNAWVGLYDKNGNRMTYEYLSQETSGVKTFNYYMSDGLEVGLSITYSENIIRTSYPWNNCGFGWRKMNKLPSSYGDVYMALTVQDGYPQVGMAFCKQRGVANSYDYVGLQSIDQAFSKNELDYQWISRFDYVTRNIYKYTYNKRVAMPEGFRVKYVYATSEEYYFEDLYDNASPFWTPGGCTGVPATSTNTYNRDPCNAGTSLRPKNIALVAMLILWSLMVKDR